ncbi:MAG: hypothetical protein ACUVX8_03780 [Candidatus Zipacnadales bacterium]
MRGSLYRWSALILCLLLFWNTLSAAFAKPIKSDPNIVHGGCSALQDLLKQKPKYQPDKDILYDKAVGVKGRDDKGELGLTLIPLDYPGDPEVGAKSVCFAYLILTNLSEEGERASQVVELSYSQPKKEKYVLHARNLTTDKYIPHKQVQEATKSIGWQVELDETQQADPDNGRAALFIPDDNPELLGCAVKTASEHTFIVFGLALGGFFAGYIFGTIIFSWW